ncbi:hypothetical protein AAHH18_18270, partial [Cellulomonas sp. P4]
MAHIDAFIHGVGFAMVGSGDVGEPDVLVTIESALNATGAWSPRTRRLSSGLVQMVDESTGRVTGWVYMTPRSTVTLERARNGFKIVARDDHN